jgi:hypothetical protein
VENIHLTLVQNINTKPLRICCMRDAKAPPGADSESRVTGKMKTGKRDEINKQRSGSV